MGFELPKKIFYFCIIAYPQGRPAPTAEEFIWEDNNPERFFRWRWYFKYRAALLQVKYPKGHIEVKTGSRQPKTEEEEREIERTRLRNRIVARKRKITEWKNKIKRFEDDWHERNKEELFPENIEEAPNYQYALSKLKASEFQLRNLELEYKEKYEM